MFHLLAASFLGFATVTVLALAVAPRPGEPVMVLDLPWRETGSALRAVAASGGSLLDVAGGGRVVLARSDGPGFADALRRSGAPLVIRAGAAGCTGRPS